MDRKQIDGHIKENPRGNKKPLAQLQRPDNLKITNQRDMVPQGSKDVRYNNNKQKKDRYIMTTATKTLKLGAQVKFVSDARAGAVIALDGDTASVQLRGTKDVVTVSVSDLKGSRGRPMRILPV